MNKANFELKRIEMAKSKNTIDTITPIGSALNSKSKAFGQEDLEINSDLGSKMKTKTIDFETDNLDKLKESLLCVSCTVNLKCMLILTCKHVPYCKECD
jgi:hypothetical protein